METLGEEACDGLAFRAEVFYRAKSSRIEIEILEEDDLEESDDEGGAQ
jgi:hypothetical protein